MVGRAAKAQAKTTVGSFWIWWKASAQRLAELQARLVLTVLYFVVIPPFAALVRWTADPLAIKPRTGRGWRARQDPAHASLERARRQY